MMQPYNPDVLPLSTIDWERHVTLIGQANAALARYDGILLGMVNPQMLLSSLTTREAVLSSRIEGTQASLEEVLQYEADVGDPEKAKALPDSPQIRDIHEIINYRKAMGTAVEKMAGRPFGINTIRELIEYCWQESEAATRIPARSGASRIISPHPERPLKRQRSSLLLLRR
jgi:Fic family protein